PLPPRRGAGGGARPLVGCGNGALPAGADPVDVPPAQRECAGGAHGGRPRRAPLRLRRAPAPLQPLRLGAAPPRPGEAPPRRGPVPEHPGAAGAHFAVPLAGCVLVPLNTRASRDDLAYILEDSGAKLLVVDHSLRDMTGGVETIVVEDEYEEFLASGSDEPV